MRRAVLLLLCLCFMWGSCAVCENVASETLICVSHLTDSASLAELDGVMESVGVAAERRAVFQAHLAQFNACTASTLHEGYQTVSAARPCYDPYLLQNMWNAAHPDFIGYNCRITAFSLMADAISIADTKNPNVANLFMDQQALQEDASAMLSDADLPRFLALFSTVEGANTDDSARQAALVCEAWAERGIAFDETLPMSLITVFFHNQYSETENELVPGHAGVLFECEDGLYFVEKLAFQAPYQAVRFESRAELKAYLMAVYDVEWGQPTARPFILENGRVL